MNERTRVNEMCTLVKNPKLKWKMKPKYYYFNATGRSIRQPTSRNKPKITMTPKAQFQHTKGYEIKSSIDNYEKLIAYRLHFMERAFKVFHLILIVINLL